MFVQFTYKDREMKVRGSENRDSFNEQKACLNNYREKRFVLKAKQKR